MSAIPEAAGARCARRGAIRRAVLRVAVLGGLVLAGWLLGSGIALADDDSGPGVAGLEEFVQEPTSLVRLLRVPPPDDSGAGDLFSEPTNLSSTVGDLLGADPVPLRVQPPVQVPILTPALAHVATTMSGSAGATPAIPSRPAIVEPAVIPPPVTAPATEAAPRTTLAPAAASPTMGDLPPATALRTDVALPVAERFAELSSVGIGPEPVAPAQPSSPPATTAAACLMSGTGSGSTAKSDRFVANSGRCHWAGLTSTYLRLDPAASGIPQSVAQQPSTSPD